MFRSTPTFAWPGDRRGRAWAAGGAGAGAVDLRQADELDQIWIGAAGSQERFLVAFAHGTEAAGRSKGARDEGRRGVQTVLNGIMVRGSIVRTNLELTEVYELHADGRTKIRRESWPLEEVNQCFAEVLEGRTHKPRIVFQP